MTGLPLRYLHESIPVGARRCSTGLFRLETASYPFLSVGDKRDWLQRFARLALSLEADVSLRRVNQGYPAEQYAAQAAALLDERRQDPAAWQAYLAGHEARMRWLRSFVPEVYLAVSLRRAGRSTLGDGVLRGVDRARRRLEALFVVTSLPPTPGRRTRSADRRVGAPPAARGGLSAASTGTRRPADRRRSRNRTATSRPRHRCAGRPSGDACIASTAKASGTTT